MDRQWSTEEARWIYPNNDAQRLEHAFWSALADCDGPYVGTKENGDEGWIDGLIPDGVWQRMADRLRSEESRP